MKMQPRLLLSIVLLAFSVLACELLDDVQDVVETVDEAVALLKEIEENGTWEYISQGLDSLARQDQGYHATVTFQDSDSAGKNVTIQMQVDGDNDILAQVVTGGQAQHYFVDGQPGSNHQSGVYRIDDGRYTCVNDLEEARMINGITGPFEQYSALAIGVQLLSVVHSAGEETVAGRTATHYELESKIPEALALLEKFDNKELQAKIDGAGDFTLEGDLYLDRETDAILRLESTYQDIGRNRQIAFSFNITQWGGVPDFSEPAPDEIAAACP